MAKSWARDRRWLKRMLVEAGGATDWPEGKAARVEERLRQILLATLFDDSADNAAVLVGAEAAEVVVAIEGSWQELELQLLALERLHRRYRVVVRVYDPATGATISESVVRPPPPLPDRRRGLTA